MEEADNQKYIRIKQSDFSKHSLTRPEESYFRSLEKYLEQNKQSYKSGWKVCTIYVRNIAHAMKIGFDFNLSQVEYFDGVKLLPLILKAEKKKCGRPKSIIFDEMGESTTLKKLKKQSFKKVEISCIEEGEVIKGMMLTKKEIKKAFAENSLSPVNIMNKCFIDRKELARFMQNKK